MDGRQGCIKELRKGGQNSPPHVRVLPALEGLEQEAGGGRGLIPDGGEET